VNKQGENKMKKAKRTPMSKGKRIDLFGRAGGLLLLLCLCVAAIAGCNQTGKNTLATPSAAVVSAEQVQKPNPDATATLTSIPTVTTAAIEPSTTSAALIEQATATAAEPVPTATQPMAEIPASAEVDFIDVGQGDAILITSSSGQVALIDGGEQGSGALQYLQSKAIDHIDLMIATHPHSDHIGGLVDVLRALPVQKVVTNGQPHTTQTYENFLDGIAAAKAEYVEAKQGDTIPFGSLAFQVLSPVSPTGDELNNNSLVLRLAVNQVSFLFTGDAQEDAEASMISAGLPLQADILKVAHHGSHTSSSPAFLDQVQPAAAVYSAGAGNEYGHPHAETIAALTNVGAQIYGTDVNGTIAIQTDGNAYTVLVGKEAPRAPPPQATEVPAQAGPLTLEIVSVTSPIAPGAIATLQAKTAPGADCTITVYYKSGPSTAAGLEAKQSDGGGNVSWSWKVGTRTTPGTWSIVVTASLNGQTVTQETTFMVQK
jgi:competence protein ComEC